MISKYFCNRVGLLRINAILNVKLESWKEYRAFHTSSVAFQSKENLDNATRRLRIWQGITMKELAVVLKLKMNELAFILPHLNLRPHDEIHSLDLIQPAMEKLGYKLTVVPKPEKKKPVVKTAHFEKQPPSKPENLIKRPPVVTVMGHVDHGKTTLLDSLRNTFVVSQEFGGITQHIGAFSVTLKSGRKITFIDTPGHAAFTAMRSRGTEVTDIVVLVIAADDGIMEQTVESIKIANAATVPIIVAVNKIDKPTTMKILEGPSGFVNPATLTDERGKRKETIKEKLLEEGIQVEDQGGDVQLVPISALKKINLDLLTETILLQADLMNLKGDPTGLVEGVIIESKMDKLGALATVIIKRGTLKKGKILVAGNSFARVRRMLDENGNDYQEATPATPVQIIGWKELPVAGDDVFEVTTEKKAKLILNDRQKEAEAKKIESDKEIIKKKADKHHQEFVEYRKEYDSLTHFKDRKIFMFELWQKRLRENKEIDLGPHLKIVLKGDVFGTLEVLLDVFGSYDKDEECKLTVIDASVGNIKPSDIEMAESFNAIIYAFNVTLNPASLELLKDKNIDIRYHNVIYKLIDDVKVELTTRIPPKDEEEVKGEAEVMQNFLINKGKKKVPVAGARCVKGELKKESLYRISRGDKVLYEGELTVMKHEKRVVKSIPKGMECGLMFELFTGKFEPGDKITCYDMIKVSKGTSWDPGF